MLKNSPYKVGRMMIDTMKPITEWMSAHQKSWWLSVRKPVENFIEFGDRNLRVIPVHSTGMTMCAKQADVLAQCLQSDSPATQSPSKVFPVLKRAWVTYQGIHRNYDYAGSIIKTPSRVKRLLSHLLRPMILAGMERSAEHTML